MKRIFIILICVVTSSSISQEEVIDNDVAIIDSLYREDQIYIGVAFNPLVNRSSDFKQNGLSAGFQVGFIRDMPLNKRRNKSIGIGAGFALDTYNQNLLISPSIDRNQEYQIIDNTFNEDFNRFSMYTLEFPVEYRWRTSTPTTYSFWRIHAGFKVGYIFRFKSTYQDDNGEIITRDLGDINTLQYGPSFSFGYGAFNFQGYYGLNPLFNKNAKIDAEEVNLQVIRLGIIFYFL